MLLLDGLTTLQILQFCDAHDMIVFVLPPHSTHLLQPLNLVVFQPHKRWHKQAVNSAIRLDCTNFNKLEFLLALNSIQRNALRPVLSNLLGVLREITLEIPEWDWLNSLNSSPIGPPRLFRHNLPISARSQRSRQFARFKDWPIIFRQRVIKKSHSLPCSPNSLGAV